MFIACIGADPVVTCAQSLLSCLICREPFRTTTREAVVLQCGNVICESCVFNIADRDPEIDAYYKCPFCAIYHFTRRNRQDVSLIMQMADLFNGQHVIELADPIIAAPIVAPIPAPIVAPIPEPIVAPIAAPIVAPILAPIVVPLIDLCSSDSD